ncbi:rRNA (adenosine-2'-O-)-methyltransferase, putative [Plasmodium relictum]|uniref:rRNA (Adenosine-2'-O-)-methyltransferase, putative n=1 Tax=Plasmodium relictum TaxID=85471 RepID=A0A1J1HD87_PLARL|nr:rRNA (adenosine-2'-O-)-methyltransferase, putative [Plasmodium relictum]CRH03858.1 rRNA (adenosine-2'-O-)-methyltransferase, putative [Plasmodium relictum]
MNENVEDILSLLINFSESIKKEFNEDIIKNLFSDITLKLISKIDKYELAVNINNYISNEIKQKIKNDRSYENIKVMVLFLDCIFKNYWNSNFANIEISWVYSLIKLKSNYSSTMLNFLNNILFQIKKENSSFCILIFLLIQIKTRIEDNLKENNSENFYFKEVKQNNQNPSLYNSTNEVVGSRKNDLNKITNGSDYIKYEDEIDEKLQKKNDFLQSSSYQNVLKNFDLNFKDLCNLFILVVENTKEKKRNQNAKNFEFIDNDGNNSSENMNSNDNNIEIKNIVNDILHYLVFINDKEIRNILIKDFCFIVKEYILTKREFEDICLSIIKKMFLIIRNESLKSNSFLCKNEITMKKSTNIKKEKSDFTFEIYYEMCLNYYMNNDKVDEYLLNDFYNFIILYIDYIYNEDFIKSCFIGDVRYQILLFNKAYTNESASKKIIYIFNTIINTYEKLNYMKEVSVLSEAWQLYECLLRCIQNFSVHLLKTNWYKMVSLLNIVNSIKKKYERIYDCYLKEKNNRQLKKSKVLSEKEEYIKLKLDDRDEDDRQINAYIKNKFMFYDEFDYFIFKCCIKNDKSYFLKSNMKFSNSDKKNCETNFGKYFEYIILRLVEYLILLLMIHKNNTVTRFSLCELINYENKELDIYANIQKDRTKLSEKIDINVFLNSMNDIFLFHIFFIDSMKPSLFTKGDIPYYEFRIKNFIISKIVKKNSLYYFKKFLYCLDKINFSFINIRIMLEGLIESVNILEKRNISYNDVNILKYNCNIKQKKKYIFKSYEMNINIHEIIINIIKNIKNISISRRNDMLILILQIIIKLNNHLKLFTTVHNYCIFLELFEDNFFLEYFEYFELLLNLNTNFFIKEKNELNDEIRNFIFIENKENKLLDIFIIHLNKVISCNNRLYFYGYMRFFHIIAKQNISYDDLINVKEEDENELITLLIFYTFKNNLIKFFNKNSINSIIKNNMKKLKMFLLFNELNDNNNNINLFDKLLLFADTLEYINIDRINNFDDNLDYYNSDYYYKKKNNKNKYDIVHKNFFTEKNNFFCEIKELYDECKKVIINLNVIEKEEDNLKIILIFSFISSICKLFYLENLEILNQKILNLEIKKFICDKYLKFEKKVLYKYYENFNYYKYKYIYNSIFYNSFSLNENEIVSFSYKVINDIEICKGELVFSYLIIKSYIIPNIFSDNFDKKIKISFLKLLLKQSNLLVDRCCACKYPTHLLELIFITLFHPLIVKFEMSCYINSSEYNVDKIKIKSKENEKIEYIMKTTNDNEKEEPFLLLNYLQKILEDGKTKLSLSRSVIIPFITSYFYNLIEYNDMVNLNKEYIHRLIIAIVDILMYKEFILLDNKKSFTNNSFKIKKGNIHLYNLINENICLYFLNKLHNNEELIVPSVLYEICNTSIFLRIMTLIFLINLFNLLEKKYFYFKKSGENNNKISFYKKRNYILYIYEYLIVEILRRIDNRHIYMSTGKNEKNKIKNKEKEIEKIPPLPSSNGHNIQIRGLQVLCCLSKYFKYLKKKKRKYIIYYTNKLLHDDHLNNTRQYLELFYSSISNSSFILLCPYLLRNMSDQNANMQLTLSSLMICSYIFLKTKYSYYSFKELIFNSYSNLFLMKKKYNSRIIRKKEKKKIEKRKMKYIFNEILKKNSDKKEIVKCVESCKNLKKKKGKNTYDYNKEPKSNNNKNGQCYGNYSKKYNYFNDKNNDNNEDKNYDSSVNKDVEMGIYHCEISNRKKRANKISSIENNYFYSEYICKYLIKLLYRIICLCSSHSAVIRSISQFILYKFLKKKKQILLNPFFSRIYSYIKNNKDCKRIREKLNIQFKYWNVKYFDDINILLPTCNYSFDNFDEDLNYNNTNTFAHILYNNELVISYTFIDSIKKIVQQEMSSIMFNVDLEKEKEETISKNNMNKNISLKIFNDIYENKIRDEISEKKEENQNIFQYDSEKISEKEKIKIKVNHIETNNTIKNLEQDQTNELNKISELEKLQNILEKNKNNYQKKFDPITNIVEIKDFRKAYQKKKKNDLIVIASLIDKVPNLAGLCRTCEIFNVKKLFLDNINIIKDYQFQKISSTANKWMNIKQLKKSDIIKYLIKKKKKYSIIGLEQTHCSLRLNNFTFPRKSILILGDEKEGIPSSILLFLHQCIEIPGQGIIRSLNVHVSAAITIYEYFKQQI